MPNRLAAELSPYLQQHADNPVDWYAWGPEALEAARTQQKPIFLSIGYSACHWCHVMAHESFADRQIAAQLAEGFISVKVDREQRPDLDQIYMQAVQAMTGHGGWPLSVFLTPELEPFFGGTYWPAQSRGGMPGFVDVLAAVDAAWRTRREQVYAQAASLVQLLRENELCGDGNATLDRQPLEGAELALRQTFDPRYGGFGGAPKFPQPLALQFLIGRWRQSGDGSLLDIVTRTLDAMAAGGIYDHLGGGFHRYSVDARWLVPHFEKMLYDNALLAGCYLDAFQATGQPSYARVVRETLDYLLRDMTGPEGGFFSSEDADSEGEEGKFYVWTPAEVQQALAAQCDPQPAVAAAARFNAVYDVTAAGNFEGHSILNLPRPLEACAQTLRCTPAELAAELAESRRRLLAARSQRERPACDDKVLVAWNALAIDALARAGRLLDEARYSAAAVKAADFLLSSLRGPDGRLQHCWRGGRASVNGLLDDYAGLGNALLTLHEATAAPAWLAAATSLADEILARFADPRGGGFYYTPADHEPLIVRCKDVVDASVPSGNGLAATLLVRLGRRGGHEYLAAAERTLRAFADFLRQAPAAAGQMLLALELYEAAATD